MIGKIYRPMQIRILNRGYSFPLKYHSNFKGLYFFDLDVYLYYDKDKHNENICMDFRNLTIPIAVSKEEFMGSGTSVASRNPSRKVKSLREIVRPAKKKNDSGEKIGYISSSNDVLSMSMHVTGEKDPTEDEWIELQIRPVVIDGEEYMYVSAKADSKIRITTNTSVKSFS